MNIFRILFIAWIILMCQENLYAFEVAVHERIAKKAIDSDSASLDSYLNNIGLNKGLTELVNGKRVRQWIEEGGRQEDEPLYTLRYLKHFYNPLDGSGLGVFNSSYVWANDYYANEWSWRAARSKYYTGLTAATDMERKSAFADSFRSVGQVMHLVQDMASVAHTRNDAHGIYDGFEAYTKENIDSLNYSAYNFANALTSVSQYAPKQFWDSDTYDGTNPSDSNTQGLAEYTNANFFSGDTVADNSFPYPKIYTDTIIDIRSYTNANTGQTYPRMYYTKNYDGETNNGQGYLISTVAFLNDWRARVIPIATPDQPFFPVLDDNVYNDYAALLLPRAVGYSAGLLNYFFRGKVNMEKDPQNAGKYIIKNESGEKMEGTFTLYYDDTSGNRNAVPGTSWTLTINSNSTSSPVTFTEPTSPAPKEKGKYILVFNGKLGMEEGAVVGFVYNPKWAFLVIKQTSIKSDVVEWGCTGCKNEWGYFTDSAHKASGMGHFNSYVLKFDLEWLGAVNTITNVALIDFYNYGSCEYNTTGDLNTTNEHTISLIRPTANTPKGYIEVRLKGNKERYWPFPRFIRVDTIGKEGNPQSFYEPILLASSSLYSRSGWDVGQYGDYYKNRELNAVSYIPYMGMCVSGKVSANYTFDLSEPSYDRGYIYSDYVRYYMYSVSEGYHKSYQQEPLLSFFPYTVEKLKIKRTWKQSTLDFLESLGYDITELPTWDIYIDYWRTEYRP